MIFEDPERKRWQRTVVVFGVVLVSIAASLILVITGMYLSPVLPNPYSKLPVAKAAMMQKFMDEEKHPVYDLQASERMKRQMAMESRRFKRSVHSLHNDRSIPLPPNIIVAFSVGSDSSSVASLEHNVDKIGAVVPDWFELPGADCTLAESVDDRTREIVDKNDALLIPRLANLYGGTWRGKETGRFLRNHSARTCFVEKIVKRLGELDADGLNVDLESLEPEDSSPFLEFLAELRSALHSKKMRLTVDVTVYDPAYDLEGIGNLVCAA
jgi:hypothetical protein